MCDCKLKSNFTNTYIRYICELSVAINSVVINLFFYYNNADKTDINFKHSIILNYSLCINHM